MKAMLYKCFVPSTIVLFLFSCTQNSKNTAEKITGIFSKNSALKSASEKINDNPGNARLYYERGVILHTLKEDSLALKDFNSAVKLDSSKAEYYSAVGDLLFEHKDLAGSLVWIRKAIELNPTDPKAHMKIAKMMVYTRDYAGAFKEINKVLKEDAMNPEAYFLKGMIYKDISNDSSSKAFSSFLTAVQIQPDYKDALYQLGMLYEKQGDSVALKYFENAYRADTNDVASLYAKGMYYQTRERYEEAKNEYRRSIISNKNFAEGYFNTGFVLMQQDSLPQAHSQFDKAIALDPTNAGAYYNRGLCNELMDKKSEAAKDYRQALTFNKDYKAAKDALKRVSN